MAAEMILVEETLIPVNNVAYARPARDGDGGGMTLVFLRSGGHVVLEKTSTLGLASAVAGDPF